jgi:hypothetical protein
MPIQPQRLPEGLAPESEGPLLAPGPISPGDIRALYMLLDIQRTLGGMEHAIKSLEATDGSHGEKIQQTARQADKTEFALSILEKATVIQGEKIQRLEKVIFVVEVLVIAGAMVPLISYFFNHFFK